MLEQLGSFDLDAIDLRAIAAVQVDQQPAVWEPLQPGVPPGDRPICEGYDVLGASSKRHRVSGQHDVLAVGQRQMVGDGSLNAGSAGRTGCLALCNCGGA